ncbi:MAG TPA: hypothetical protein VJG13_00505, partial [Thermoanaerobaculia bacterium]|nr:hypothetical protein [Thermoanaerobaculia bacterium]
MSDSDHPSAGLLARFLRGEEAPEEGARIRAHLEAGCVPCLLARNDLARAAHAEGARELGRALGIRREPLASEAERSQLLIGAARRLERLAWLEDREETVGAELLRELDRLPREERPHAVRHGERYQLLGFARHLTAQTRAAVFHDVARAVDLGELAVDAAECLDTRVYLSGAVADAAAMASAGLGNARRVAVDLVGAERAFRTARERLAIGSGDDLVRVEYLSLLGSLRLSQAAFGEARRVLEEALALSRRLGTSEQEARIILQLTKALGLARRCGTADQEGKIVLKLAKAMGDGGDPEAAVALLERSAHLLDRPGEGDLSHYRLQVLATFLVEAGRPGEAREAFERVRPLWLERMTGAADRQRLFWLGARIAWGEGERARAELQAVRDAFRDQG